MGCHFLLQEIFRTQGLNLGLLHWRQTLYRLSHQGTIKLCKYFKAWGRDQLHFPQSKDKIQLSDTCPCGLLRGSRAGHYPHVFTPRVHTCFPSAHTHNLLHELESNTKASVSTEQEAEPRGQPRGTATRGKHVAQGGGRGLNRAGQPTATVLQLRPSLDGDGTDLAGSDPAQEMNVVLQGSFHCLKTNSYIFFKFSFSQPLNK